MVSAWGFRRRVREFVPAAMCPSLLLTRIVASFGESPEPRSGLLVGPLFCEVTFKPIHNFAWTIHLATIVIREFSAKDFLKRHYCFYRVEAFHLLENHGEIQALSLMGSGILVRIVDDIRGVVPTTEFLVVLARELCRCLKQF